MRGVGEQISVQSSQAQIGQNLRPGKGRFDGTAASFLCWPGCRLGHKVRQLLEGSGAGNVVCQPVKSSSSILGTLCIWQVALLLHGMRIRHVSERSKEDIMRVAVGLLTAVCCFTGCSSEDPFADAVPGQNTEVSQGQASGDEATPTVSGKYALLVAIDDGKASTNKQCATADAKAIREAIESFDWENTPASVKLYYDQDRVGFNGLEVTKLKGELRAIRTGMKEQTLVDDNSEVLGRKSPPLESLDEAIKLMVLFRNDREKLNSMALEWQLVTEADFE